ncbi:hypothetical protein ACSSS7_003383 [Eimeria intestinalis]
MGAAGGAAAAALRREEHAVTGSKETSSSNSSSKGILDVCSSISEYLLQLHAAAPSIHPVPCGSFFTAHTTLADLTTSSSSSSCCSSSSSNIARDLFSAVTQRRAEGDPKGFKTFARNFHEAATRRLNATTKSCSVCGAFQQQQDGGSEEDWCLCLLPHLDPAKRLKSFPYPEASQLAACCGTCCCCCCRCCCSCVSAIAARDVAAVGVLLLWPASLLLLLLMQIACGRCLGVLRLPGLLAAASANVLGDSASSGVAGEGRLAVALKHFIALNANNKGPRGPLLYSKRGCSSTNRRGLQQQPGAAGAEKRKSSRLMQVSTEAQQRALDVSLAAAFAIQVLTKEIPWKLRGPADTLQRLVECMVQTSDAAPASSTTEGNSLRPVKPEPEEEAPEQQRKLQQAGRSKLGNSNNSRENEALVPGMTEGSEAANAKLLKTKGCGRRKQHQRVKTTQKEENPITRKKLKVA